MRPIVNDESNLYRQARSRSQGTVDTSAAAVFIDGKQAMTPRGPNITSEFKTLVEDYIERRFGAGGEAGGKGVSEEKARALP